MKIAVVVQSKEFLNSAGVQIRYVRFQAAMHDVDDAKLSFVTLDTLQTERQYPADVYLFVKTFTPDALVMMAHLSGLGKIVGQDLFDDYFSQAGDARLARFRTWLGHSAPFTDFAVCTTPRMSKVVRSYLPDAAITPIDDPMRQWDREALDGHLGAKLSRMRNQCRVRLVWFGIGDNPYFPVGLQDLIPNMDGIADLQTAGWSIDLTVLTNDRALNGRTLSRLTKGAVPVTLKTWSAAAEQEALADADVVLLPVSGQSFSVAKSLNRAITAIEHGCQVISQGYPLYRRLDPFIYTDVGEFALDLTRGVLRLSPSVLDEQAGRLRQLGDPGMLTANFLSSVREAMRRKADAAFTAPGALCVLHGMESPFTQHKLVSRLSGISVKTPFHDAKWNYHVRFESEDDRLVAFVEKSRIERLAAGMPVTGSARSINDHTFFKVALPDEDNVANMAVHAVASSHIAARLAIYPALMACTEKMVRQLFAEARVIVSERNIVSFATQPWQRPPPDVSGFSPTTNKI